MDESVLFPSPNWFQVSGVAVTKDGWVIYGGPSKSLCVLQPVSDSKYFQQGSKTYKTLVFNKPQPEKVVSVDVSSEWPEKRCFIAGSFDGSVKQWCLEEESGTFKIKSTHSHEAHNHDKEEVVAVGYANETYAVTVGGFGNVVKWNLNSNVIKSYSMLKNFKPACMACSPHKFLNVAVGTKQGVVFVLDLNDKFANGKVLYKVRAQDDDVISLSWCPQYNVTVLKKLVTEIEERKQSKRMDRIRQDAEKETNEANQSGIGKELPDDSFLPDKEKTETPAECEVDKVESKANIECEVEIIKPETEEGKVDDLNKSGMNKELPNDSFVLEKSGVSKNLPDDSFNDTEVVDEDDMFDIYKDHEADEFGHKKYQPETIKVKTKEEKVEKDDFLAECLKLKSEILKKNSEPEDSIELLVNALDKTHVDKENENANIQKTDVAGNSDSSIHTHNHLLATVGKHSGVRVWSKTGKLVSSCAIPVTGGGKNQRGKPPTCAAVLWYTSGVLLIADGKGQLLESNPLTIDNKNKLDWHIIHTDHKRGLFSITTNAPRVQTGCEDDADWFVMTSSQDRNVVIYSVRDRRRLALYNTCGGLVYMVQPCPYDARKMAVSVGDGAVRVCEFDTSADDDNKFTKLQVSSYWKNVQGRVLTAAWHPTKEHLLAFATRESRVGLIDTSGKGEKAARTFTSGLRGGIYSICWGDRFQLYACASGDLVRYDASNVETDPTPIEVVVEGQGWEVSCVRWTPNTLLVGSNNGAVAALSPTSPHELQAVTFVYSKMIHTTEWHPVQTSSSSEESPYKNLIAVCSLDKQNNIVILEYGDKEEGGKKLSTWKTLTGHKASVLQLAWNPHRDGILLSTAQDNTVRVWSVLSDGCVNIFESLQNTVSAAWLSFPNMDSHVLSGGSDFSLRLWDTRDYPASEYDENKDKVKIEKKKSKKKGEKIEETVSVLIESEEQVASNIESKAKVSKKFLLPLITKQISRIKANGLRKMLQHYINSQAKEKVDTISAEDNYDMEWFKIFGTINEINDALDTEMEHHEDTGNTEPWMVLSIFRGQIDAMMQFANKKDMICPYLLSITPCVSFKYWKDATQLYLAQIDRLAVKGEEHKLSESRQYGGSVFRRATALLALHDIKSAVAVLVRYKLFKEAYVLCRIRYMDSIAEQTLQQWAEDSFTNGQWTLAAICYVALGNISQAATTLGKSNDEENLSLAAELAKLAGQNTFAEHVTEKQALLQSSKDKMKTEEDLEQLPSRIELLMKDEPDLKNGDVDNAEAVETSQ